MYVHRRYDPNDRYRDRRRRAPPAKRLRRTAIATALLAAAAAVVLGATFFTRGGETTTSQATARGPAVKGHVPREIRGVHVTMGLASIEGKLGQYFALRAYGLNTIELDVKDENGSVGFASSALPKLALDIGSASTSYDAAAVARAAHDAHIYLIGRVVTFADPTLAPARTDQALQWPDGSVWHDPAGLAWLNPYDKRNWRYAVGVGRLLRGRGSTRSSSTTCASLATVRSGRSCTPAACASRRIGRSRVSFATRASASIRSACACRPICSGSLQSRDLGVGQSPKLAGRYLDAIYPMVYPSHFVPGEYHLVEPRRSRSDGRERAEDYRSDLAKDGVRIVPWLQDFSLRRPYGLAEVEDQVEAARQTHVDGFLLWNPLGVYTQEALASR